MGIEDLAEQVEVLKETVDDAIPAVRMDISWIIRNNIRSVQVIEHILDQLLGYVSLGKGDKEFRRLNGYYANVEPEKSKAYAAYYTEMSTKKK